MRLVDRLDDDSVNFFIHIDKKVSASIYNSLVDKLSNKPNVYFIKRYTCYWAGFGIVEATIQGIKELLDKQIDFDYLALLSGQDYPIKTNLYIRKFLLKHKGNSFIHYNSFPYFEWKNENNGWGRIDSWHFLRQNRHYTYPKQNIFGSRIGRWLLNPFFNIASALLPFKRTFPTGFHPYGGAQFWCLYKTHVQYVHSIIQQNTDFVSFFRYVFVPDEIFFQTIIGNSAFKAECHNDTLTYVEWYRPGATLYKSDADAIMNTFHLFARKFDTTVDAEILDIIDREILSVASRVK